MSGADVDKDDDDEVVQKLKLFKDAIQAAISAAPEPYRTSALAALRFRETLTPETDRGCALMRPLTLTIACGSCCRSAL